MLHLTSSFVNTQFQHQSLCIYLTLISFFSPTPKFSHLSHKVFWTLMQSFPVLIPIDSQFQNQDFLSWHPMVISFKTQIFSSDTQRFNNQDFLSWYPKILSSNIKDFSTLTQFSHSWWKVLTLVCVYNWHLALDTPIDGRYNNEQWGQWIRD